MKKVTLLVIFITTRTLLMTQNIEIEGKAKITVMDPATDSAQQVAREPDGTLSLISSSTPIYAIGDFVQGGVVFWVSASGAHAKVVSIYDVGPVPWSNIWNPEIGASAQSDRNGAGNTVAIMMQPGHTSSAARHCADLGYGGYDDWYLPSKYELNAMYNHRIVISMSASANGGEGFTSDVFWSSTEDGFNKVWRQNFGLAGGGDQGVSSKGTNVRVRAVRAF